MYAELDEYLSTSVELSKSSTDSASVHRERLFMSHY
jgi:hypothetical protein